MAIQTIGIGTSANDGTGDQLRVAFDKVNDNFAELGTAAFTASTAYATSAQGSIADSAMQPDAVEAYTKAQYFANTPVTYDSDGTYTWDLDLYQTLELTVGSDTVIDISNPHRGATYVLLLKQDGTGSWAVSWTADFLWAGGTAPTLGTAASAINLLSFYCDGTYMYGNGIASYS